MSVQVCPRGWNSFNSRCYYISAEKKSWADSQLFCRERGTNLVIIDSSEKQVETEKSRAQTPNPPESNTHSNVICNLTSVQFFIFISVAHRTWCSGQPDNHRQRENCVETRLLEPEPHKRWNDLSCDSVLRWICEKKSQ
uniref:C-type lectin domain-containing protein n=1 Tax=Scleropages formosus TaxID=113540 RepID=A0A8C9SEV3_SCLFO